MNCLARTTGCGSLEDRHRQPEGLSTSAAPVLGILLSLAGSSLDNVTRASLQLIGQAARGVYPFLTGPDPVGSVVPTRLEDRDCYRYSKLDPTLAGSSDCCYIFTVPTETAKISVLLSALPSGFFGTLFGVNYRLDPGQVGSTVIASTAFSIVTLAITELFP